MDERYQAPVSTLLTYGDASLTSEWPDYPGTIGLRKEHVPELIRMATDESLYDEDPDGPEVWAPVHAWRALAQLGAAEAAGPLAKLLDNPDDDWAPREIPRVMQMLGTSAIPELASFLSEGSRREYARGVAVQSLQAVAQGHPDAREQVIGILKAQLDTYRENGGALNGFLIRSLIELGAKDAAPLMIRAYNEHEVNSQIVHWDRIQEFAGATGQT